ncbi:hypothetical protein B5F34_01815 [Mediterranea sp. An20]|nr:hypothetical protein B5F34_01815 [Mediterranea sp. An20]
MKVYAAKVKVYVAKVKVYRNKKSTRISLYQTQRHGDTKFCNCLSVKMTGGTESEGVSKFKITIISFAQNLF